jgi:hypothetical protein
MLQNTAKQRETSLKSNFASQSCQPQAPKPDLRVQGAVVGGQDF